MTKEEDIPDDWIFVNHLDVRDDSDMTGALYIDPTGSMVNLVQINSEPPHDLIKLYNHEIPDLIHSLVDLLADR